MLCIDWLSTRLLPSDVVNIHVLIPASSMCDERATYLYTCLQVQCDLDTSKTLGNILVSIAAVLGAAVHVCADLAL